MTGFCITGPYNWVKTFPTCITNTMMLHSPINLERVVIKNESISPLELRGFDVPQKSWTVVHARDTGTHHRQTWLHHITLAIYIYI